MSKRVGNVFLDYDGNPLEIGDSVSHSVGGVDREGIPNVSNSGAYKEINKVAFIDFVYISNKHISEVDLAAITSSSFTLNTATGIYVYNDARVVSPPEVDDAAGTGTLRIECSASNVERLEV